MRAVRAKQLRNQAREVTVGMPALATRRYYKQLKKEYKAAKRGAA